MANPIESFNKVFDNQLRLGIMSVLMVKDALSFNELKTLFDVTDGNLATHLKKLEEAEYIIINKTFQNKKPLTVYAVSELGKLAFKKHIKALENMIKQWKIEN
jgi:DNA-binding HxlR family transcriptional regulator